MMDKPRRISEIIVVVLVVRKDEATGSIPVSSTIFPITYSHPAVPFCLKLVQNNFQRWVPRPASGQSHWAELLERDRDMRLAHLSRC
jgi:hypothetical protein